MSAADAVESVSSLSSLTIEGRKLKRDVAEGIVSAEVSRNISGSSLFELRLHDSNGDLLRSPLLKQAVIAKIDDRAYELVKVRKTREEIALTFEDLAIANLRSHDKPLKVAPNTTTHVDFVRRLVGEESWLKLVVPPNVRPPRAKVELSRGDPTSEGGDDEEKEDSWTAIGRIGKARGWRRFVRNRNEIWYVPDKWLYDQKPAYKIKQFSDGVDEIDFDFDAGKPVASAKVIVRSSRWSIPVGSVVEIVDAGPADGKWLIQQVNRDIFSLTTNIDLIQPSPELPEPEPQAAPEAAERGESGYGPQEQLLLSAGGAGGSTGLSDSSAPAPTTSTIGSGPPVGNVVSAALAQRGKPYIWGGKTTRGFDCSGLVSHATRLAGRTLASGSVNQYNTSRNAGTIISVQKGINTRGALLFRIGRGSAPGANHVAISLGNGQTIEAKGRAWGVGVFSAYGRGWNSAAYIPGFSYSTQPSRPGGATVVARPI
ncbi:MAG: C40 family peptidase [Dermatophilaceae bacterium]|nr:C40 family peptidase [Intrasporangiaceae bacterium]